MTGAAGVIPLGRGWSVGFCARRRPAGPCGKTGWPREAGDRGAFGVRPASLGSGRGGRGAGRGSARRRETPLSIDALPCATHGREQARQRQAEEAGGGHLQGQAVRIRRDGEACRERTEPFLKPAGPAAGDEPGAHGRAGVGALPRLGPVAKAPDLDADGEAAPGARQPEQACRNAGEAAFGAVDIGAAGEDDAARDRVRRPTAGGRTPKRAPRTRRISGSTVSRRVATRIRYGETRPRCALGDEAGSGRSAAEGELGRGQHLERGERRQRRAPAVRRRRPQ